MFVRTERLFLRPGWPEDMGELLEMLREDDAMHVEGASTSALPRESAKLREYLAERHDGLLPHLFINLRQEDGARLIGAVGLGRSGSDVELRYWIARRYRGFGFAAEALKAVLAEARMLGHRRIVTAQVGNDEAASGVLESSGFRPTSQLRARAGVSGGRPSRLYVAELADKLFDLLGVGPQKAAPA